MKRGDAISTPRRLFFSLGAAALPFLLLGLLEGILRLLGWGGYPPFIRSAGVLPSGPELFIVEPAASKPYFFANPERPGYADQSNFLMPKPEGTFRIFLFGESAAKGYPQPRNLAMSAFLEAMLEDAWPGQNVEVINLGTTAVASFPIVYMVREALAYTPDLFIFYTGNNEFFGAYGTESINAAGLMSLPLLRVLRAARGLAMVQAVGSWLYRAPPLDKTLMEEMMGRAVVPVDAPSRTAAARNLRENLTAMLDLASAANVPAIVCTTASNESGLAPLGEGESAAREHFIRGRTLAAQGDRLGARQAFLAARDLDTMPWRPTGATEQAIREAAASRHAILCDVAERFRTASPDGAAGWDLVDDHVHLSVRGQALAARAMLESLPGLPRGTPINLATLPDWTSYIPRLGTNFYDGYSVNHTLRVLFGIPFMRKSNPEAFRRFDAACRKAEQQMHPAVLAEARRWQTMIPHAGGLRPLVGMAARALLAQGKPELALPLYERAQREVPGYTSWHIEYVYFALACREKIKGALDENDRMEAARAIAEGRFLLTHGINSTGLTERYVGRLYQLRGEWAEAIPMLLAARKKLRAEDLVACDQALVMSYQKTGQPAEALALIEDGIQHSGAFAPIYRQLKASAGSTPP